MLRGDEVNDQEGYRAVLTEQGASASRMAAEKFLDTFLIKYIHQTKKYKQCCPVVNWTEDCKLGYSRTLHLQLQEVFLRSETNSNDFGWF